MPMIVDSWELDQEFSSESITMIRDGCLLLR